MWPVKTRGNFYQNSDFLFPGDISKGSNEEEIPASLNYQYGKKKKLNSIRQKKEQTF